MEYSFATIPLFHLYGAYRFQGGAGDRDIYEVMTMRFQASVKGGIGMATVGANAVFAAVTGSSIASASVYSPRFRCHRCWHYGIQQTFCRWCRGRDHLSLGMIIPPSAMLIIYSFVAEQSVGDMFLAGVIPGILLAIAYVAAIWFMGRFTPGFRRRSPCWSAIPNWMSPGRGRLENLADAWADRGCSGRDLYRLDDRRLRPGQPGRLSR